MRRLGIVAVGLALAGLIAVAGCGGGNEEPASAGTLAASPLATKEASPTLSAPSPTPPVETRAELEALLKSMALTLADLPSGFTVVGEDFTTGEEAATDWLLSYAGVYSAESLLGEQQVWASVVLYEDANRAGEDFASAAKEAAPGLWAGDDNVKPVPMSFAQVGEESAAFQVKAPNEVPVLGVVESTMQLVYFRRGRALGLVATVVAQGPPMTQELEAMARKLDQRMMEALE